MTDNPIRHVFVVLPRPLCDFTGRESVVLCLKKSVAELANGETTRLGTRRAAGKQIILLFEPLQEGGISFCVALGVAEVVQSPANLLGPSACRMREEGKVGPWFADGRALGRISHDAHLQLTVVRWVSLTPVVQPAGV